MPRLGDHAIAVVMEYFEGWRRKHPDSGVQPQDGTWYKRVRARLIDRGLLTTYNCMDTARNTIKNQLFKQNASKGVEDVD